MKSHSRIRWVQLQVESRRFDRLLFLAVQLRKAVGECVGDAEFHQLSGLWRSMNW